HCKPSGVTPGPGQALDEALAHWISNFGKDNRQGECSLLQDGKRGTSLTNEEVRLQRNKLCCQPLQAAHIAISPALIDLDIFTLGPSQALKFCCECRALCMCLRVVFTNKHQHADAPHLLAIAVHAPQAATLPRRRVN